MTQDTEAKAATLTDATPEERQAVAVIVRQANKINNLLKKGLAERIDGPLLEAATQYMPDANLDSNKIGVAFWNMGEAMGALRNLSRQKTLDAAKEIIARHVTNIGHRVQDGRPAQVLQKLNTALNVHAGGGSETAPAAAAEAENLRTIMGCIETIQKTAYEDLGISAAQGNRPARPSSPQGPSR